ncbi:hypothetical protein LPB87_06475 [Flavobacterium sp. EDS]|uniref:hypothetical protein n=1 Tax=Flavobacterium sp. EDS TaxID=2897328 RepID=UPI001E2AF46D|nr:hypothetical protein [Flavobacterium sp. EDS]MCD0474037.1 hypothetical protein [Flavobacterium sp. EDS]
MIKKFALLIFCTTLTSCFKEPKKDVNKISDTPTVHKESAFEYDISQAVDTLSSTSSHEDTKVNNPIQSISLFSDINGIQPKVNSFNDIKSIIGEPDYIDITKLEFDKYNGEYTGGNKIVKYNKLGLEFLFTRDDISMSSVNQILIKENFKAVSDEGIFIGMSEQECINILNSKYYLDFETDISKSYSKTDGGKSGLQIWFKNGKLEMLAIY